MAEFKIFETKQFLKSLSGHPESIKRKLTTYAYPQLRQNPYFGKNIKKLRDYKPETWRYKVADYRFFYEVDDKKKLVFIIDVDSRKNAYR